MATIQLDSRPVSLDSLLNVSVSYSFNPLKQVLEYLVKKVNENADTIVELQEQLELAKSGFCFLYVATTLPK